jgi:DNA-binding NarL/FixJ family response regulator
MGQRVGQPRNCAILNSQVFFSFRKFKLRRNPLGNDFRFVSRKKVPSRFSSEELPSFDRGKGSSTRVPRARVLIVEDHPPFRHFISGILTRSRDLKIIGEVYDGLEAVQKAEELKPDLILLDIGLPTLNGIDAARRICKLVPECKIIFVSMESDVDVMEEAVSSGLWSYVVKTRVAHDLLPALDAVREGRQFVSDGLSVILTDSLAHKPQPADSDNERDVEPALKGLKNRRLRIHPVL